MWLAGHCSESTNPPPFTFFGNRESVCITSRKYLSLAGHSCSLVHPCKCNDAVHDGLLIFLLTSGLKLPCSFFSLYIVLSAMCRRRRSLWRVELFFRNQSHDQSVYWRTPAIPFTETSVQTIQAVTNSESSVVEQPAGHRRRDPCA